MTMVYHDAVDLSHFSLQSANMAAKSGKLVQVKRQRSTPFFDFVYNNFLGKRTPLSKGWRCYATGRST